MKALLLAAALLVATPALAKQPTADTAPGESCGQGNASFCDDDDNGSSSGGGSADVTNNVTAENNNTNSNQNNNNVRSDSNSSSNSTASSNSNAASNSSSYSGGSKSSVRNTVKNNISTPRQQVDVPDVPGPSDPNSVPTLTFYFQKDGVGPTYGAAISIPLK